MKSRLGFKSSEFYLFEVLENKYYEFSNDQ